jgi:excisionase family DNA binding protein
VALPLGWGAPLSSEPGVSRERLLTTREVAAFLGVSPETVLRLSRAGEFPGYRLASNVLRFRESELEAWLEGTRSKRSLVSVAPRCVSVFELARIMGTSVRMIERHYRTLLQGSGEAIRGKLDACLDRLGQEQATEAEANAAP